MLEGRTAIAGLEWAGFAGNGIKTTKIGAVLVDGKLYGKNPCVAAIESAKNGGTVSSDKKPEEKNGVVNKANTSGDIYQ